MAEHFCTYFDHKYIARGILMIESLRAACSDARIHVLALSDLCRGILQELGLDGVTVVDLAALEAEFPALAPCKRERTPVEYIFTLTPFLPQYCFDREPGLERITYLDADLYFFGSPRAVFDAMGGRSIGIIPHRFSPDRIDDRKYGEFNVGWVTFRRSSAGLACLRDYQAAVLEWCYDRVEDGKFADQKYLDSWPGTYADLSIIMLKGANVAAWNADNYGIEARDGQILIDDEALIFYHFHGVRQLADGNFSVWMPKLGGIGDTVLRRRLYRPYLTRLLVKQQALARRFPALASAASAFIRGPQEPEAEVLAERQMSAESWRDDPALDGWRSDFVTRARIVSSQAAAATPTAAPLVRAHIEALSGGVRPLSILEFGGGLGDLAEACRGANAAWDILEVPSVCDHGAVLRPSIRFLDDPAAAGRRYDLVIACGALHYAKDWDRLLRFLAEATTSRLVLLDLPVVEAARSGVMLERPREFGFRATMQSWLIARSALSAALASTGLAIMSSEPERPAEPVAGAPTPVLVGHVLKRAGTNEPRGIA